MRVTCRTSVAGPAPARTGHYGRRIGFPGRWDGLTEPNSPDSSLRPKLRLESDSMTITDSFTKWLLTDLLTWVKIGETKGMTIRNYGTLNYAQIPTFNTWENYPKWEFKQPWNGNDFLTIAIPNIASRDLSRYNKIRSNYRNYWVKWLNQSINQSINRFIEKW